MLMDRNLSDLNPSATAVQNLKKSWILTAGAFQEIYKQKLGNDVLFAEQLESVAHELSPGGFPRLTRQEKGTGRLRRPVPSVKVLFRN